MCYTVKKTIRSNITFGCSLLQYRPAGVLGDAHDNGPRIFRVPPGTVCFQCDFGGGVATDSVFQLNNLNVGGEVGSVESGVLAIFAAVH